MNSGYVGWLRLGHGSWRAVVGDNSKDDCLALLLRHSDGVRASHKDLVVLEQGIDPNGRPVAYARVTGGALDFINAPAEFRAAGYARTRLRASWRNWSEAAWPIRPAPIARIT
jgi:hypothetical protein